LLGDQIAGRETNFLAILRKKRAFIQESGFGTQDAFRHLQLLNRCNSTQSQREIMADFIRIVFSVLLPPVGVFLQVGLGLHFWLSILLTLCGYIPGLVHAIWIIARTPQQAVA
jgi:uncharacterized membrane protein YqaE (UPF0057 family)